MNQSDTSNQAQPNADHVIDVSRIATVAQEILADMNQGACAETIAQTVQIFTLANGKKAALRVIVTTDQDLFL